MDFMLRSPNPKGLSKEATNVAPGIITRNKKLLVTTGIATSNKSIPTGSKKLPGQPFFIKEGLLERPRFRGPTGRRSLPGGRDAGRCRVRVMEHEPVDLPKWIDNWIPTQHVLDTVPWSMVI